MMNGHQASGYTYNWIWSNFFFDVKKLLKFALSSVRWVIINIWFELNLWNCQTGNYFAAIFLYGKNCRAPDVKTIYICHWLSICLNLSFKRNEKFNIFCMNIISGEKIANCSLTLTRWMSLRMVTVFISSNREIQSAQRIRSFSSWNIKYVELLIISTPQHSPVLLKDFPIILQNYNFQNVWTVVCLMLWIEH